MSTLIKSTQVLQQGLALDLYLKTLLADVPEADPPLLDPVAIAAEPLLKIQEVELTADQTSVPVTVAATLSLPAKLPDLPLSKVVETASSSAIAVKPAQDPVPLQIPKARLIKPLSVMPEWSRSEFQALFFKVDHLILATPLTELSRTLIFNRKPTKIPMQPAWFLGLLEEQGKKVGILDTGQLIFGKLRGSQRDLIARPFKSLLISGDGNWGLACDEILSVNKIIPDKVRWRTFRKKRPWLIGTVIEELTAVIDITQLLPGKKTN